MGAQLSEVGRLTGVQVGGELTGEFGLAAALSASRSTISRQAFLSGNRSRKRSKVRR